MFEYKQEISDRVSLDEYETSKAWRADAEELTESLRDASDDLARGRFTMRLLEKDQQDARDQLVEIVGANRIENYDAYEPVTITVSPVLKNGTLGGLEHHTVAADGIILNNNSNTPNFEKGYFVGGDGVGEDELQDFELELRVPIEAKALKAMALPLP